MTYTVTYNGNGSDDGSVPVDDSVYAEGGTVTVLGNTGTLTKTGYAFVGWNTTTDGNGTSYDVLYRDDYLYVADNTNGFVVLKVIYE